MIPSSGCPPWPPDQPGPMPANAATTALLHHRSGHDPKSDSRRRPAITGASFKLSHPAGGLRSAPVGPASVKPPARTFLARKGGLQHRCNYRRAQRTKAPLRRTETKALSERSIATPRGGKSTARSVLDLTTRLSEGVAELHVRRDRTTFMFTETVPTIN